jgi:hypothetical protein
MLQRKDNISLGEVALKQSTVTIMGSTVLMVAIFWLSVKAQYLWACCEKEFAEGGKCIMYARQQNTYTQNQ